MISVCGVWSEVGEYLSRCFFVLVDEDVFYLHGLGG